MKKLSYLLIFVLSVALFLGCQEEERADFLYNPSYTFDVDADGVGLPMMPMPGEALLRPMPFPRPLPCDGGICVPSAWLSIRVPIIGPRPLPCDAGICEPAVTLVLEEDAFFDPEYAYMVEVIDLKSGEVTAQIKDFSLDKSRQVLSFATAIPDLRVPSGFSALTFKTKVVVDEKSVPTDYMVGIEPESLEKF